MLHHNGSNLLKNLCKILKNDLLNLFVVQKGHMVLWEFALKICHSVKNWFLIKAMRLVGQLNTGESYQTHISSQPSHCHTPQCLQWRSSGESVEMMWRRFMYVQICHHWRHYCETKINIYFNLNPYKGFLVGSHSGSAIFMWKGMCE